jgi:hypothetical protein
MRTPNLFIVGAPKCATTTLHAYLAQHPECFMSPVKEPAYFSRAHVRDDVRRTIPHLRSEREYLMLFSGATSEHRVVGESSTCYMRSKADLQELKNFSGDPHVIALVRDPVSLVSSYFHYLRFTGWEPLRTLREAWNVQDDRCAGHILSAAANRPDSLAYRNVALLGQQVERLFEMFGRGKVLVLLFDDLRDDTESVGRSVQDFLGLTHADISMPHSNVARAGRMQFLDALIKHNSRPVVATKNTIKRLFGVRSLGIRRLVDNVNATMIQHSVETALRDEMRGYFRRDVELLGELLDRDLLKLWGWEKPEATHAEGIRCQK